MSTEIPVHSQPHNLVLESIPNQAKFGIVGAEVVGEEVEVRGCSCCDVYLHKVAFGSKWVCVMDGQCPIWLPSIR